MPGNPSQTGSLSVTVHTGKWCTQCPSDGAPDHVPEAPARISVRALSWPSSFQMSPTQVGTSRNVVRFMLPFFASHLAVRLSPARTALLQVTRYVPPGSWPDRAPLRHVSCPFSFQMSPVHSSAFSKVVRSEEHTSELQSRQ